MGYREMSPPADLFALVETAWVSDADAHSLAPHVPVRVLPDGCMDLIRMDGRVVVAGPDTSVLLTASRRDRVEGLRFRPGALPRLLGVPAAGLLNQRVPLDEVRAVRAQRDLVDVARDLSSCRNGAETAPWSLDALRQVTAAVASGVTVDQLARDTGWSTRTLQRQCQAVYGYGPAMLRRILRFRSAVSQLRTGVSLADVAVASGYSDQPHLQREVRAFADTTAAALAAAYASGANRSTEVPSGSSTVA